MFWKRSYKNINNAESIDRAAKEFVSSHDLKYISLEAKIANNKDLYYEALKVSQDGWLKGKNDPVPFIKYLLGTILAAYKDFGERFSLVEDKKPALEIVRMATLNKIGRFTKQDIRELCPSLSISYIEGALRTLVDNGELRREGAVLQNQLVHIIRN